MTTVSRVVYILSNPLTLRDHERFGMGLLHERGCRVSVLDIADCMWPEIPRKRDYDHFTNIDFAVIRSWAAFQAWLETLRDVDLIVFMAASAGIFRRNWRAARIVSRLNVPILIWANTMTPGWERNRFVNRLAANPQRLLPMLLKKDLINSIIYRLPISVLGIRPADYVLVSNPGSRPRNQLWADRTRKIPAHSFDYDIFLNERARAAAAGRQAVFVDQWYPFHDDFKTSGTPPINADDYFAVMRQFFDQVETKLGLEVVIAAHPRADYERVPGAYGNRKIISGQTARLVIETRLTLMHASTAVNFSVLARKPVMILTTKDIDRYGIESQLFRQLSEALDIPIVHIDDAASLSALEIPNVDESKYRDYVHSYIKSKDSPDLPLWQIALDAIESASPNP